MLNRRATREKRLLFVSVCPSPTEQGLGIRSLLCTVVCLHPLTLNIVMPQPLLLITEISKSPIIGLLTP